MDISFVNNILNEEIYDIGRCSGMCWIIFGTKEKWDNWESYSLHLQCPWRIRKKNNILISDLDIYELSTENKDEKWDDKKKNIFDEKIIQHNKWKGTKVERIEVTEVYDLKIFLSDSSVIECFVDDLKYECWRLFKRGIEEHLVITGRGIDEDEDE